MSDAVLDAQPLTSFASFCATPGILSAQCTLIETWPQRQLPERRPDLLLALVWYSLHRAQNRPELDHDGLLPVDMRLLLANLATMDDWRLPPDAGGLVHLLAQAADAMQDAHGGRTTVLPLQQVFQRLAQALQALSLGPDGVGQRWWPAVVATGLAYREMDRASKQAMFRFVHPQFQELFAALGLRQDRLPDLEAPKLSPQPGQALLDSLKERGSQLALPQVTPHHERVRMAVVVALPNDRQAWLRRLLRSGNIGLAAQAAIDVKDDLEPDGPYPGDGRAGPHKVLQHLRRVLLLRSMDAGAAMHGQLRAGCVLGADANHAALAEHMTGVDAELDAHWRDEWQVFESGAGRDIRERIQAGLLLGELRDNLRYEFRSAQLTDGRRIAGVRLKPNQWLWRGTPGGGKQRYRIGSDQGGDEDERPSWTVDLAPFQMARYAVTVEEWLHFIEGGGYDRTAPWWQSAGQAAKDWLIVKGGSARRPSDWADSRHNNPMQPVRGISHFEALAYAAWADLLDQALQPGPQPAARAATSQALTSRQMQRLQVGVPTEVHWEAGVWGPDVTGLPRPAGWAHLPAGHSPGVLDLNHGYRLRQTAPVGSYSAGATADGLFDVAGNVWEWCANAWTDEQRSFGWRTEQLQQAAQVPAEVTDDETRRALRGGAFDFTATQCRPSYRHDNHPGYLINNFGVRLVRWWPPHSGHWTPKG